MARYLFLALFFWAECSASWVDAPRCYWEISETFFDEKVVKEAFELFSIYQSSWQPLYVDLSRNARQAKDRIKKAAKLQARNPLEYPFDPQKAKEILVNVEKEIFYETVNYWRIWDERTIGGMFAYILEQNGRRLAACK